MSAWLSLDDALEQVLNLTQSITDTETISIFEANGRILSVPVNSPRDVPPWDNSAMDGYAITASERITFDVEQTLLAGSGSSLPLSESGAARIMTGAPIPPLADAVVMQENVERNGDTITIKKQAVSGQNIRLQGEDVRKGQRLFNAGDRLGPAELILLSSIGIANVEVVRKPKVAIVATGDELVLADDSLNQGQIYESHRVGLIAKLEQLHCDVTDAGIAKDDPAGITALFENFIQDHDLIISSGGVSVGEADWVKTALENLGTCHFWKIAIKPGKPFVFGQFGTCMFCGLPGNPVSAYITFDQMVTPVIAKLQDSNPYKQLTLSATLTHDHKRRPGRLEFARGSFVQHSDGALHVTLHKKQTSGVMTSLTQANCYVILNEDTEQLAQGDSVLIQPFSLQIN